MQVSKKIGYCLLLHYLAYTDQTKISSFSPSQKASAKFTNLSENADTIILPTEETVTVNQLPYSLRPSLNAFFISSMYIQQVYNKLRYAMLTGHLVNMCNNFDSVAFYSRFSVSVKLVKSQIPGK